MPTVPLSWSALSTLERCPLWFHAQYVGQRIPKDKDPKEQENKSLAFGNWVHNAIAERLVSGAQFPERLSAVESFIAPLCKRFGQPAVEHRMAVDAGWAPVEFFADNVLLRGVLDAFWCDRSTGVNALVDWKTGRPESFDTRQLRLQALMVLAKLTELDRIAAGFVRITHDDPCVVEPMQMLLVNRSELEDLRNNNHELSDLLVDAIDVATQPEDQVKKTPGPYCRWCPVTDCAFNRRGLRKASQAGPFGE